MRHPLITALATAAIAPATLAQSVTIHAVGSAGFGEPELYIIDAHTGTITSRQRTTGIADILGDLTPKGLDFSPNGTLYTFTQVPNSQLYTLDPDTAVGTPVGDPFLVPAFEGGLATIDDNTAILTNGYLAVENYLLTLNLNTGFNDIIVLLDRPIDLSGVALRDDGAIIGMDTRNLELPPQLVVIDPDTGSVTTLAVLQGYMGGVSAAMEIHDGVGYLVNNSRSPFQFPTIYTFDPYTGQQTFLATIPLNTEISGIAIAPGTQTPPCPADADASATVDVNDILLVLENFGRTDATGPAQGDLDDNNTADVNDLLIVLNEFGTTCPE